MNEMSDKPTIFISYSHEDEAQKDLLPPHPATLELQDLIERQDDSTMDEGGNRHPKLEPPRAMVHEMAYHRRDRDLARIEAEVQGSLPALALIQIDQMRALWLRLGLPLQSAT